MITRRIIITLSIVALMVSVGLAKCSKQSMRKAIAQKHLSEAKIDSVANYQKFKGEADVKISDNRNKITSLKAKTPSDDKAANEKYDLKILSLEQTNNELEERINDATDTRIKMWLSFMREFNHDMGNLERSIKEMGI